MFENMILLIAKDDYENFKQDEALFKASEKYLNDYLDFFENREKEIKANLVSEEQILDFLSKDKDLTKSLKAHLDEDLEFVKTLHAEYIKGWKYYNEFEKLCKDFERN